jgi:cephalosporin-C deacetylase-like acetyl esterase
MMRFSRSLLVAGLLTSSTLLAQAPPAKTASDSPANAGRAQLADYLDGIASQETAARREALARITTRQQAEVRVTQVRARIWKLMGGEPQRTPLNAKSFGTTVADGFSIERVMFDSQPGFHVTALLYLPAKRNGKMPAILVSPGHAPTAKISDYANASMLAQNGFVVLTYDPIGMGERAEYLNPDDQTKSLMQPTGEHGEAGLQPTLLGDAVARYFVWDAMRAVDYLASRPEVDPNRIGAFGCSGGGTITSLLGAMDTRVKAVATGCFITTFDKLLPTTGPQDAEQSLPDFIASGLDTPDWVEAAAPRPYAIIATLSDPIFPFAGARDAARESRRFYSLFDPASTGVPTGKPEPGDPTGPTMNPDTSNDVPVTADLQFITGIGGHGNLRPLAGQIVTFFLVHLAHSSAAPVHLPPPPPPGPPVRGANPFGPPAGIPKEAFQVTPTGQVLTSYPTAATIQSLNWKRAQELLAKTPRPAHPTLAQLQKAVREVTHADARPGAGSPTFTDTNSTPHDSYTQHSGVFHSANYDGPAELAVPSAPGKHPAVLLLFEGDLDGATALEKAAKAQFEQLAAAGNVVLAFTPRPDPPGTGSTKGTTLGSFYLVELRAELVGKTLLGLRVDDTIAATDLLASRPDVDAKRITAYASGHMGLVLLHASVLDARLKHVTIDHALESYASLMQAKMTINAPEDILPGVYLRYDTDDLKRALGSRLTWTSPLPGTADLSMLETSVASGK